MSVMQIGMQMFGAKMVMPMSPLKNLKKSNFIDFSNPEKTEARLAELDLKTTQHNTIAEVLNLQKKANKESLKEARNA